MKLSMHTAAVQTRTIKINAVPDMKIINASVNVCRGACFKEKKRERAREWERERERKGEKERRREKERGIEGGRESKKGRRRATSSAFHHIKSRSECPGNLSFK